MCVASSDARKEKDAAQQERWKASFAAGMRLERIASWQAWESYVTSRIASLSHRKVGVRRPGTRNGPHKNLRHESR